LFDAAFDTFKPFGLRQLIRKGMLPVPYACKGKRLHFHGIPQEVNEDEGNKSSWI
jgi:hypothetical protein